MRLLLDQNLPSRLLRELDLLFPGSAHVRDLGLREATDLRIWEYAAVAGYSLVTKDADFREIVMLRGFPPKVVLLRYGNVSNAILFRRLLASMDVVREFLVDEEFGCLELE